MDINYKGTSFNGEYYKDFTESDFIKDVLPCYDWLPKTEAEQSCKDAYAKIREAYPLPKPTKKVEPKEEGAN